MGLTEDMPVAGMHMEGWPGSSVTTEMPPQHTIRTGKIRTGYSRFSNSQLQAHTTHGTVKRSYSLGKQPDSFLKHK